MKRFHVLAHVNDRSAIIVIDSKMFETEPARAEGEHAKRLFVDPRINFAISTRSDATGVDDLGIHIDGEVEPAEPKTRANAADLSLLDEGQTAGCHTRSEQHGLTDPQGIAWEHLHVLGDIPVSTTNKFETASACCGPSIPSPVEEPTPATSCSA